MNINTKQYIEEYIKIRDKSGKIIDFKLNKGQQKLYDVIKFQKENNKPVRIIILKARQIGFSTLTEAILFKETATKFNVNTGIITHKEEATTNLFNMSKRMYDNLPKAIQPSKKASNAKELIFDNKNGTGLKSKIKCMTAGSSGVGRSDTFTNLHISELAFWGNNTKETMIALSQAVPNLPNTMIIIESTANGFEYFKSLWDMAVKGQNDYIPVFVGWNELDEYKMKYTGFELDDEEKKLQKLYNISLEQLTWRRWCIQNNCGGDIKQFNQEYPINPEEAFISSGTTVFDTKIVTERIQEVPKPIKVGYFLYDYDGLKITNIRWVNSKNGYIKIYKVPNSPMSTKYCIGGDTAGEGSDYFVGQVLDAKTGEQVAVLRHQMDADVYAKQMYCLGKYYSNALIGIEANFDSYPIKELNRLKYKNMYVREREDNYTKTAEKKFGFKTTQITRPLIISMLTEIVREHTELINDIDTLQEMLVFIKNDKGRPEAQEGEHDDLIMALAISYYIRNQVVFSNEVINIDYTYQFNFEKPKVENEIGDKIEIV